MKIVNVILGKIQKKLIKNQLIGVNIGEFQKMEINGKFY